VVVVGVEARGDEAADESIVLAPEAAADLRSVAELVAVVG
jgi:hypothetical protein